MEYDEKVEATLRDYLLGQLTEDDQKVFEERLLTDNELFQKVESKVDLVEDDLVEAYLLDELNEFERSGFDQRLLRSSKIRDKLLLERALVNSAGKTASHPVNVTWMTRFQAWMSPLMTPAPALAASFFIMLVGGGVWSVVRIAQLENELARTASQQIQLVSSQQMLQDELSEERRRGEELAGELDSVNTQFLSLQESINVLRRQLLAPIATAILKPGILFRGSGETNLVSIPDHHRLVELGLDLGDDDYPGYRMTLYDAAGGEISSHSRLDVVRRGEQVLVMVRVAAGILNPGDYSIRLDGVTKDGSLEAIDRYPFTVPSR